MLRSNSPPKLVPFMAFANRMTHALRQHWHHYLAEAGGPLLFLVFSSTAAVVFHHPGSPVARALGPHEWVQRLGMGVVMGLLVAAMAYSPWGKRSGGHFNPAVTLGFWHLGHIRTPDALWYGLAQFSGALLAGFGMCEALKPWFGHPAIHYNTTRPAAGAHGWAWALGAEAVISAGLMLVLLMCLHSAGLKKWTGALVGLLLAAYVTVESPLSGMSLNPARTLGAAAAAGQWQGLWLYFAGPLLAMWATAAAYRREHRPGAEHPPTYPDPAA